MSKHDFKAIAEQIKKAIEVETEDNPEAIKAKISELAILMASAAALQANAKKELLKKETELLMKYEKMDISPSVLMRKISAECFEENAWLTYSERLGAGLSHGIEGLRSCLSYIKSEMENSRHQDG